MPSARFLNLVANILNNISAGTGIKMDTPQTPSSAAPFTIGVDTKWLQAFVAGDNPSQPAITTDLTTAGEGTVTAKTGTWAYTNGTNGVQVTLQTRTFYDHTASSPVLYGFYRTFSFDGKGRLLSVSAETRYVIDTPVVGNLTT